MPFNMFEWRENFKDKAIKPEQILDIIKPGDIICIGSGCSEPTILTEQLVKEPYRLQDCEFLHFFTISNQKFFSDEYPTNFRHDSLSMIGSPELRVAINEGKADFTPMHSHDIPRMLKEMRIRVDVALIQVSPPDKNGYCSLGINVDINVAIVKNAKKVIAHVNPAMPRTMGDSFINFVTDIDYFVYETRPLVEFEPLVPDKVHEKVAFNVAKLIENGSTLNLGIGKITNALPKFLLGKKDLSLYSEVAQESIMLLFQEGVINNKKNHYPHSMACFALGTQKFYEFVDNNPAIQFYPSEFITDISYMIKNHKLCSIYSGMVVDLLGQVTNHMGTSLYSGIGGEADFMRGSALSKGGKSIIALTSTTSDGKSRIVPFLPPGLISLRAFDVQYVITEWGIAHLHGKNIRERVLQIISIAAPQFRQSLLEKAKEMHYIYEDQVLPTNPDGSAIVCPDIEWTYVTKSKGTVTFRPVLPADERLLQELYYSLSSQDREYRFLAQKKVFSHEDLMEQAIKCDYHGSMVIVGVVGESLNMRIIAEGSFYKDENSNLAEISVTVHEDYRGQGLAYHVFEKLIELAQERGIKGIIGTVHVDNRAIRRILNKLPYRYIISEEDEFSYQFLIHFDIMKDGNDII
ncbi:MAG: GNAT family N-acetyltransferase [Promethearchaeota archaeon]